MATGVGTGFDISKFTDALKKADTALTNLVDKQNQLSRVTMNAFKQMSEQGVVPYVESLKKQVSLFDTVKASITDASGKAIKGFGWMKTNIVDATNELNKLINALEKTKQFRGETSGKTAISYANKILGARGDKSIDNMKKALQQLEAAQNRQNLRTKTGQKNYEKLAESIRLVKKELDKATGSSEKMNKSVGKIEKSNKNLLDISGQLQRRLALVFSVSQIGGYINKIVKVRGEFELQQRALQAIVQNVDEANKLWDKTVALAVKSPFRVKELVTYTKQLAAYRIETSKLYDTTKRLADVSAGLGVDMQRLILAYGQVRAASFLRGTELRQFTEAGIPMLEELAKHFTELEGRAISVGDVFERISKRMVTFQDVAAVFQRMTNEGGVFYNMQAKQSETLKGQISNLHDAIDLTMNDIGKSNDSILKSLVSTMRTLVDNWKAFATAIEEVGTALAVIHLARFATGLRIAAAGHAALAISMKGSISIGAKFQKMINTLFATIKAHPFIALSGAILTALYSLYKYNQSIDEANEKYNEMSRREMRRAKTLSDLNDKVLQNNKVIKDNNKKVEEQNDAIKKNNEILIKIKNEYPDLYNAVVKQTDGTIDLTEAIKLQDEELRANIALQQQAKGGFWQENQGENYEEAVKAQQKYASSIDDLNSKAIDLGYQLEYAFRQGDISEESYKKLKDYLKLISETNDITALSKKEETFITSQYGSHKSYITSQKTPFESLIGSEEDRNLISKFYHKIEQIVDKAARANIDYSNSLNDLWDNFKNQIPTFSTELNKITNAEDRGKWLKEQLNTLQITDKKIQEWARTKLIKELKIEIIFPQNNDNNKGELDEWAKRVKAAIEEVNKKIKEANPEIADNLLFPIPEVGQTKEQYLNAVKPALEAAKAVYRKGQKIEDESAIERTNALKPYADTIERILNIQDKNKTVENEALQRLKEQIRLVRELAKDYQKLWDEQGKDVADASIWSKERIAAFRKAGLDYTKFEVGSEGDEVKNLEKLNDISGELYKAIADARTELGSFKQQLKDAEFARYLEELFGNYEVSLELEKLNIPPDLAKRLFGVESIDLNSIRKEILSKAGLSDMQGMTNKEIFSSERYLKLNKEQRKIVEDGLKKEDELQQKALEERLKRYSQFLVKGQSEAVKVKIQELRDLKKLEEDYRSGKMNISELEYQRMVEGIKKESNDKIAKLSFDDFQDSTMYKNLFSDIQSVGTKSIDLVLNHLYKLRDAMKDVPPEVFAKLQERIDELEKLKIERNPFKGLEDAANTIKKVKKERETYTDKDGKEVELKGEDALNYRLIKNEEEIQQENKKLEILYQIKEANGSIDALNKVGLETNKKALTLLGQEDEINNEILDSQKKINKLQGENKGIDKQLRDYSKAKTQIVAVAEAWVSVIDATKKAVDSTKQIFIALGADADSAAMDIAEIGTSFLDATAQLILFAAQMQIMQAQATALGKTLNAALGPIGWIAAGLSALATIAVPLFGAHDKEKEREIQAEINLVNKLEHQYKKLEKSIDEAYEIDTLKSSYDQAQANLDQQIAAYNKMIEAEKDKKDSDSGRIAEWERAQEELEQAKEDLKKSTVEDLGGNYDYKSATRDFVDAWLEAFNETGNGMDGLKKHFKSFWKEIVLNQVVQGGATKIMKPLMDAVNTALEYDFKISKTEEQMIDSISETAMKNLDEYMKVIQEKYGDLLSETDTELSGLQRGIQGKTENQADVLASYLNSIRMFVSSNNQLLAQLVNLQGGVESASVTENPMLPQLRIVAQQTTAIRTLLDSVVKTGGHSNGGAGIKVFMS